ncbi:uncharacterized protein LOC125029816 [Penaeus chinensis]|uniref:uncharacterized protein LOC125029816 n=1 Tax=Penaeus chinensis TaxID=139456 RepID=UPI001FB5CCF4|nr:uncharacterized protein LOC125029816 [Penaeus chinensis]
MQSVTCLIRYKGTMLGQPFSRSIILVLTLAVCIFLAVRSTHLDNAVIGVIQSNGRNEQRPDALGLRKASPSLRRQAEINKIDKMMGIPILMMIYTYDATVIQRSIESVLDVTSGSRMHLVVSIRDPSAEILSLLREYPVTLHTTRSSSGLFHPSISRSSILQSVKYIFGIHHANHMCVRDTISPENKFLHTTRNFTEITTNRLDLQDMYKYREVPFMENPYSPTFRKAVLNDQREHLQTSGIYNSRKKIENVADELWVAGKRDKGTATCDKCSELKEAFAYVLDSFPSAQHMFLLADGYMLSPDFVSYFSQTIEVLREDPTLYCVSAYSPLASIATSGDAKKVYRVDQFLGKGSLIERSLAEEILKDFIIFERTLQTQDKKTPLDHLETWLSWWSRRRRRGCVVPDVPRACTLAPHPPRADGDGASGPAQRTACSLGEDVRLVNVSRLLHYKYGQDLFGAIAAAEPMGNRTVDCRDPLFFSDRMNGSSVVIYIKMENYDDDFTFHHVMKCFGLDLPAATGYFEGVFRFSYRGAHVLVMAIPYSRFSPALKNTKALMMAEIPGLALKGRTQYYQHQQANFTFQRVPVRQVVD